MSRDPAGFDRDQLNLASFARSNPIALRDPSGRSWISWAPILGTGECLLSGTEWDLHWTEVGFDGFPGQSFSDYDSIATGGFAMTDKICNCGNPDEIERAQAACEKEIDALGNSFLLGPTEYYASHLIVDGAVAGISVVFAASGAGAPALIITGVAGVDAVALGACIANHASAIQEQAERAANAYCACNGVRWRFQPLNQGN